MNTAVFRPVMARSRAAATHDGLSDHRSADAPPLEPAPSTSRAPTIEVLATHERGFGPGAPRTALVVGAMAAMVIAWFATGSARAPDPELAMLLRGMAAIKGLLAVSAGALVWWRLGQTVSSSAALTYIASVWMLCASAVLIWQLAFIVAAAVLFHAAWMVGMVVAMREGRETFRVRQPAPGHAVAPTV